MIQKNNSVKIMQHPQLQKILVQIKNYLANLYQDQLDAIILYGSQARKDAQEYSDIDLLIILKSPINPYQEIDRTSQFVSQLCLDYDIVISRHFISSNKFKSENTPFLYNVKKEGIAI